MADTAGGGHAAAAAPPVFLKVVNFDPKGQDHWQCDEDQELNSYTFKGSYYHVYVKLASCDTPKGRRAYLFVYFVVCLDVLALSHVPSRYKNLTTRYSAQYDEFNQISVRLGGV